MTSSPELTRPETRRYAMFISYRHADNLEMGRKWATWLHEAVENYEIPKDLIGRPNLRGETVPGSLYPVFRDEEELPADADLSTNIRRALENSSLLVVICSPRAVRSRFVADEIRYFKEIGKSGRILALIVDGEPNASDDPEKMERLGAGVECFPEALRFGVPAEDNPKAIDWEKRTEPIAADCRPGGLPAQGWTTAAAYEAELQARGVNRAERTALVSDYAGRLELAKRKVVAGALGLPLGELTQRDKVRQLERARKRSRILGALTFVFAALAATAGLLGWLANQQRQEANKQSARAESEKTKAVSALALSDFQEGTNRLSDPAKAREGLAYLARAARAGHNGAEGRIWTVFQQQPFWTPAAPPPMAPAAAAEHLTGQQAPIIFQKLGYNGAQYAPSFFAKSGNGERCVTIISAAEAGEGPIAFRVWETKGIPVGEWRTVDYDGPYYLAEIRAAVLSDDGRFLAIVCRPWREPEFLQIWDVDQGKKIAGPIVADGAHPNYQGGAFVDAWFAAGKGDETLGPKFIALSNRGDATLFQLDASGENSSAWALATNSHSQAVTGAALDDDAELFVTSSLDRTIRVNQFLSDKPVGWPIQVSDAVSGLRIDGAGKISALLGNRGSVSWELYPAENIPAPKEAVLRDNLDPGMDDTIQIDPEAGEKRDFVSAAKKGDLEVRIYGETEVRLVRNGDAKGVWSRKFPAPVLFARFAPESDSSLVVQTTLFTTEIWDTQADSRVSPVVDESVLFTARDTPDAPLVSSVSADGRFLLTRSYQWTPPNQAMRAFTVWDLGTGKAMSDRKICWEDIASDDIPVTHAEFTADSRAVLFGQFGKGKEKSVSGCLWLTPPDGLVTRVSDLAEAMAGSRLSENGGIVPATENSGEVIAAVRKLVRPE